MNVATGVVVNGIVLGLIPNVCESPVSSLLFHYLLGLISAIGVENEHAVRSERPTNVSKICDKFVPLFEGEVAEIESANNMDLRSRDADHVAFEELHASRRMSGESTDIVFSPPVQRGLVEIDAVGFVRRTEFHPLTGDECRAAEIFAKQAGRAPIVSSVDAIDKGDIGFWALDGLLVQVVFVSIFRRIPSMAALDSLKLKGKDVRWNF